MRKAMTSASSSIFDRPPSWRRAIILAGVFSLLFHGLLLWFMLHYQLNFGPPMVDPVEPMRPEIKRTSIDPKSLESEIPPGPASGGSQSPPQQRPMELEPDKIAAFSGPVSAPKIPISRLTQDDPSPLSAAAALLPSEAFTALPRDKEGNIPQMSQALANEASTAALKEANQALGNSNLLGGGPGNEIGSATGGVPGFGEISSLVSTKPVNPVERPAFQPILIRLSSDVLFAFDSATLLATADAPLRELAAALDQVVKAKITVEGHSDTFGADDYNIRISEARARVVADWLAQNTHIKRESFAVRGYGKTRPIVNPYGSIGEQAPNRRVEIRIEAEK